LLGHTRWNSSELRRRSIASNQPPALENGEKGEALEGTQTSPSLGSKWTRPTAKPSALGPSNIRIPDAHQKPRRFDQKNRLNREQRKTGSQTKPRPQRKEDPALAERQLQRAQVDADRHREVSARKKAQLEEKNTDAVQKDSSDDGPDYEYEKSVDLRTGRTFKLTSKQQKSIDVEAHLSPADLGELWDKEEPEFEEGGAEFQGPWNVGPDFKLSTNEEQLFGKKIVAKPFIRVQDYSQSMPLRAADFSKAAGVSGAVKMAQIATAHHRDMDPNRTKILVDTVKSKVSTQRQ
jgi:hypothetical protein